MSTDTEYQPINCDDYEYLELACQRRLKLQIQLQDGSEIEVQAEDLVTRKKVEYLIVGTPEGAKNYALITSIHSATLRSVPLLSITPTSHLLVSTRDISSPLIINDLYKGFQFMR